jgi:hypothetical protein
VAIATWLFPIVQRKLSSLASDLPVLFAQLITVIFKERMESFISFYRPLV